MDVYEYVISDVTKFHIPNCHQIDNKFVFLIVILILKCEYYLKI
jgi:hypothetical protein